MINKYFYNYDESPLLIINTSSVDVNKPHDYSMLLQEINKEVKGKKYFNPLVNLKDFLMLESLNFLWKQNK